MLLAAMENSWIGLEEGAGGFAQAQRDRLKILKIQIGGQLNPLVKMSGKKP